MVEGYDFIKSETIKDYLKGINYQFTKYEIANLIFHNLDLQKEKKIKYLKDLMNEYPDENYKYMVGWYSQEIDSTFYKAITALIANLNGDNKNLPLEQQIPDEYYELWSLPVPFKDGDIVYHHDDENEVAMVSKGGNDRRHEYCKNVKDQNGEHTEYYQIISLVSDTPFDEYNFSGNKNLDYLYTSFELFKGDVSKYKEKIEFMKNKASL